MASFSEASLARIERALPADRIGRSASELPCFYITEDQLTIDFGYGEWDAIRCDADAGDYCRIVQTERRSSRVLTRYPDEDAAVDSFINEMIPPALRRLTIRKSRCSLLFNR